MTLKEHLKTMKTTERVEVVYWDKERSFLMTLYNNYVYNVRTSKSFKTYSQYEVVASEPMDDVRGQILYIRKLK